MFPVPVTSKLDPRFTVDRVEGSGAAAVVLKAAETVPPPIGAADALDSGSAALAAAVEAARAAGGGSRAASGPSFRARLASLKANCRLSMDERVNLVLSVGEECIDASEVAPLLERADQEGRRAVVYDGFEPSGRMHLAQALCKATFIDKLSRAGMTFVLFLADYHAMLNNKMGGDLEKIRVVGDYMIEVWRACGVDIDGDGVEVLFASDAIGEDPDGYWARVLDVSCKNTLKRILRCTQIMGRSESDDLSAAQLIYPCMQAADIFYLGAEVCQLGMDQRKVNMLAREYCDACEPRLPHKPIILSHHMMPGLKQGTEKMSKSIPDSAIFMEDSERDVIRKVNGAYCPPKMVEGNPCVEMVQHVLLPRNGSIQIEDTVYSDFPTFAEAYAQDVVTPQTLKVALTRDLNAAIEPVRRHFQENAYAKSLLERVKSFQTTR